MGEGRMRVEDVLRQEVGEPLHQMSVVGGEGVTWVCATEVGFVLELKAAVLVFLLDR